MLPWNTLAAYLRHRYGQRVQKIPLDAGASCPNRDGTLSRHGCIFCNGAGAGSGFHAQGNDIHSQWRFWQAKYAVNTKARKFLAYFQSFSNTYGPVEKLAQTLEQTALLPDIVGISLGTRPDCLNPQKLRLVADCPLPEVWLELGLQSCHNATLIRINRQHSAEQAAQAVRDAAALNIKVVGHLMAGLPGESIDDFLNSVRWAAALPLHGIKLHGTFVPRHTELARQYAQGLYTPLTQEAYVQAIVRALTLLPAPILIHRLTGDPTPEELIAPLWTRQKTDTLNAISRHMLMYNLRQGCCVGE
ncbi:MAG: TIGR01212 family radical SAM protein [Desulfovibrionaceae bacterium]